MGLARKEAGQRLILGRLLAGSLRRYLSGGPASLSRQKGCGVSTALGAGAALGHPPMRPDASAHLPCQADTLTGLPC